MKLVSNTHTFTEEAQPCNVKLIKRMGLLRKETEYSFFCGATAKLGLRPSHY
jgi:hypothetical protein